MAWRPNFGRFYAGPWPYDSLAGVGLCMTGAPVDPGAFIELMQDYSCNPPAARRILDELRTAGSKRTTVMAGLDFVQLGESLARLGVVLSIIEPAKPADQRLDEEVFARVRGRAASRHEFSEPELAEVDRREAMMRRSLQELPASFGRFD